VNLVRSRAEQRSSLLPVCFSRVLNQLGEPIGLMGIAPASARAGSRGYQRRRITSRRTWRRADVVTHLPLIMCIPAPHAWRTCVTMLSD
jgi:hypothetical protein